MQIAKNLQYEHRDGNLLDFKKNNEPLKKVLAYTKDLSKTYTDAKSCCPYEQCQQKVAKVKEK